MMPLLFDLVQLIFGVVSRWIGYAAVNVCIPRVPPRNWNNKVRLVICISKDTKGISAFLQVLRLIMDSIAAVNNYVDLSSLLISTTTDNIFFSDVSATLIETPKDRTGDVAVIRGHQPKLEDSITTILNTSMMDVDFSIYSDASSPNLNKALFITLPRSNLVSAKEFQLSLLKAASERISEILRENRRRLDAGEDPNTSRKEARRRRAQELLAARNKRDSLTG